MHAVDICYRSLFKYEFDLGIEAFTVTYMDLYNGQPGTIDRTSYIYSYA